MKNKGHACRQAGFTLIEIIVATAIMLVFLSVGVVVFVNSSNLTKKSETLTIAQSLAQGKMEESLAKNFTDISSEAKTAFSQEFSDYNYEIAVIFVTGEALDVPVSLSDYKKITIKVYNNKLQSPVQFDTIKVNL